MHNIPNELLLHIVEIDPLNLQSLCSTNKKLNSFCKTYGDYIRRGYLEKYQVNYQDPGNFIYFGITDVEKEHIINSLNYKKIFRLYLRYFAQENIICYESGITSFPIYPNMITCDLSNNQ